MSEYCQVKTAFKDRDNLVTALMRTGGWRNDQIEVHQEAQHLYGFQGDMREQTAHVIVRRQHVGGASNDLGWERQADGTYLCHISQYDSHRYGAKWQGKLKQHYALACMEKQARMSGRKVTYREQNGKIMGEVVGY